MDPVTIISIAFNIITFVAKEERQAEMDYARAHVEQKVVIYRTAKGPARRMVRADIQRMQLPENARAAQRALVSARTQWQIDISAALVEGELR